jgi:hypothetical protein
MSFIFLIFILSQEQENVPKAIVSFSHKSLCLFQIPISVIDLFITIMWTLSLTFPFTFGFTSYIVMCLGIILFEFVLLRVSWATWTCKFRSLAKFGRQLSTFKYFSLGQSLSPFFWSSIHVTLDLFTLCHRSLRLCSHQLKSFPLHSEV